MNSIVSSALVVFVLLLSGCNSSTKKVAQSSEKAECCAPKEVVKTSCCSSGHNTKNEKSEDVVSDSKVMVYYFHGTRRCETCQAVEKVTRETVQSVFPDQAIFTSLSRDDEKVKSMLEKYSVSGQTLIVVQGDKVKNITNEAFLYARSNPKKLQAKLTSTIESILK
ncbi:hypothetical protein E9993_15080 [Labilibacter sediminis]|nr:hypothetical protein E9993_15080 [Labilibacter sediminis]